jgi:hypothetical protein
MSGFESPLIVEIPFMDSSDMVVIQKQLVYRSSRSGIFKVNRGFISDLASIPKGARWLISKVEKHSAAAVIHDALYVYHPLSKEDADDVFLEAMAVSGVPLWKRVIMYLAVKYHGGQYFDNPDQRSEDKSLFDHVPKVSAPQLSI